MGPGSRWALLMGPGPCWALLMGPGPCWALLAPLLAPLLRCAAGREYSLPYTPQFAQCKDPSTEFYDEELNKCCSQCPPDYQKLKPKSLAGCGRQNSKVQQRGNSNRGVLLSPKWICWSSYSHYCTERVVGQYKTESCSHSADTKCRPCRPNTYTAVWNLSPLCFACSPPCRKGFVQNQTCTKSQDRTCSCPPNEYCILKIYDSCKICEVHKKCGKGYRVSRKGTDSTDTECKPCPPGTFSHEESYDTSCVPHTVCKSVAVPGNNINDTVCSDLGTRLATVVPHTILNLLLTQSSSSNKPEIITRPVILNSVPDVSHIIGSVAGPLLLILIIAILGVCLVSKKKALVYSPATTEADLPISPAEKLCDKKVRNTESQNSSSSEQEKQRLLETSGSSSSSLNNPAGSASVSVISNNNEKPETEGFQQQPSAAEGCQLHGGDRHNSASSELSGNGGTHVNVTCIVKVCSPDCSSQFPEQNSSTSMDRGNAPYYSPTGEEIPLSKEENPLKKQTEIQISVENDDNLLQDLLPEEKNFPLGIQDAGMKNS